MSPTILRVRGFRLYFLAREESRAHVHVHHPTGEAKIWLEPTLEVARNVGLSRVLLAEAVRIVRENEDGILRAWAHHFHG